MVTYWLLGKKPQSSGDYQQEPVTQAQVYSSEDVHDEMGDCTVGPSTSAAKMQPAYNNWIAKEIK